MYEIRIYVSGQTQKSAKTIENLRRVLDSELKNQYSLDIIDVLEKPELAERDKVLATPTVAIVSPLPLRRIVGDLSDKEKVLAGLNLLN
jgi:circadian clock protein KaiB